MKTYIHFLLTLALVFQPFMIHAAESGVSGDFVRIRNSVLPTKCTAGDLRVDSGTLKKCNSSNTWEEIASSGGGGVNFLTNGKAESVVTGWVAFDDRGSATQSGNVDATGNLLTFGALGCRVGQKVRFTSSGTPPGGLTTATDYWISTVAGGGNTYALASTFGGSDIDITSVGTGTMTMTPYEPCDGTGGTPTATLVRSTSTPLSGVGSFLYTPGTYSGQGFSANVTIPRGYWGSILTIERVLELGSYTNYTDGDITYYVYNVDESKLIYAIEGDKLLKTSGPNGQKTKFQVPSGGSFAGNIRIIGMQTTATTTWTSLKFDDVAVGPQNTPRGPPVTDAQTYTPTFTGMAVDASNVALYWRVGDQLFVKGFFGTTSVSGTTASLTLPPGLNIDSAKVARSQVSSSAGPIVGKFHANTANQFGAMVTGTGTATNVVYFGANNSGGAFLTPQAGSSVFSGTIQVSYDFQVPIAGWGSNGVSSAQDDGRVVAAVYNMASAQATDVRWNFATKVTDTHNAVTTGASWAFTAPISGLYLVQANYQASGATVAMNLYKNGVVSRALADAVASTAVSTATAVDLVAGDTIYLLGGAGGTLVQSKTQISITRVAGPQTIMAADEVSFRYYNSSQAISASTNTTIICGTKDWDTHAAYNSSTGVFTVPAGASGIYQFDGGIGFVSAGYATDNGIIVWIYKNGVQGERVYQTNMEAGSTHTFTDFINPFKIKLAAGDTVYFQIFQNTSGTKTFPGTQVWIQGKRVGYY